jgi:hypothetical protein
MSAAAEDARAFSSSELRALEAVTQLFSALSLSGSLFICFSYAYFTHLRNVAFRLVLFVSISDVLYSVACASRAGRGLGIGIALTPLPRSPHGRQRGRLAGVLPAGAAHLLL